MQCNSVLLVYHVKDWCIVFEQLPQKLETGWLRHLKTSAGWMRFLYVWLANPGNPATSPLSEMKEDRHACTDKEWETEKKEKGEGGGGQPPIEKAWSCSRNNVNTC